jgi:bacillaene synthase trans-acting acyltransferase
MRIGACMIRPIIFMFSGQGSQYHQMGKEFYDSHPVFRRAVDDGDAIVGDLLGRSVRDAIFSRPVSHEFNDVLISHPALVTIEHATCRMLVSEGIAPDWVWGCSAGEFSAAVAAGAWDLEVALRTAVAQARYVVGNCPPGGMLAVLASPTLFEEIADLAASATLAAVNYASHFVLSGFEDGLLEAEKLLRNRQIACLRLPVLFGFHSPAIDAAALPFNTFCSGLRLRRPSIPMLSSATATQVEALDPSYFWQAVRQPIRFREALDTFGHLKDAVFIDCGPSGTLATFLKHAGTRTPVSAYPVLSPYRTGVQNLQRIKEHIHASPPGPAHARDAGARLHHVR